MKLSDYLAEFLHENVAGVAFGYQGSSVCHIIDSISNHAGLTFVESRHEQGAAFAATAYALANHSAGVAVACSGPGAINLLTGVADAFYDSIPCLFICGQVSTGELRTDLRMRQLGFQETDIVAMARPVVKYAAQIRQPERIAYELEKACWLMREGRPGPVLLDIPHNVQRSPVDPETMEHFTPPENGGAESAPAQALAAFEDCFNESRRPLILLGGGCDGLCARPDLRAFLAGLKTPVAVSYRGRDVWSSEDAGYCGVIGAYGNRAANWAAYYSDALLCVGSRLDGRQTGGDMARFAPKARIFAVDLDPIELEGRGDRVAGVRMDATAFLEALAARGRLQPRNGRWAEVVEGWRRRTPLAEEYDLPGVNPNGLLEQIGRAAGRGAVFTADVGQNQIWTNTSLFMGRGARLLQSAGLGSMGYALPAALGAAFAEPAGPVVCLCGDGGFQMNLQEMQTIALHRLPVKVFVFNNGSLGLIRIYQQKALGGRVPGSVTGFGSPDYEALAKAYGFRYVRLAEPVSDGTMEALLKGSGPLLAEVCLSGDSTCNPEPTYMRTVENQSPLLPEEIAEQMRKEAEQV